MRALEGPSAPPPLPRVSRIPQPLQQGQYIYVLYAGEPGLWHERLICGRLGRSSAYAVLTPDNDLYIELFDSDDFLGVRVGNNRRTLPAGLGAAHGEPVYRFQRSLAAAAMESKFSEASALVEAELRDHAADYPAVHASLECGPDEVWVVMSNGSDYPLGSQVPLDLLEEGNAILGNSALVYGPGSVVVYVEKLHASEVDNRINELRAGWTAVTPRGSAPVRPNIDADAHRQVADDLDEERQPEQAVPASLGDARILPVRQDAGGSRYRSVKECADLSKVVAFDDWPLEGPRTCDWHLRENAKLSIDPAARHARWRSNNGQKEEMKTCVIHEMLSEIYDYAITIDQLDVVNLVSMELLVRFLQHVESEVKKRQEASKDVDNSVYFLGRTRKTGGALICPLLVSFAAERATEDYRILKEQRKAAEERKLAKK